MGTAKTRPVPRNALHRAMAHYAEATAREQEVLQCMHAEMEEVEDRYRDTLEALADSRRRATDAVRQHMEVLECDPAIATQDDTTPKKVGTKRVFMDPPATRNPFRPTPRCRPL